MLHRPQAAFAIERCGLHVAVTKAPDFRQGAVLIHKGIVGQRFAVRGDAEHLAQAAADILRLDAGLDIAPLANSYVKLAFCAKNQARAEVLGAVIGRQLLEDDLNILQGAATCLVSHEACRRNGSAIAAVTRFGEGEIDKVAGFKVRRQRHVKQAALPPGVHFRHAGDLGASHPILADDMHGAGLGRHQHASIGQKFHCPELRQLFSHHFIGDNSGLLGRWRPGLPLKSRRLIGRVGRAGFCRGACGLCKSGPSEKGCG